MFVVGDSPHMAAPPAAPSSTPAGGAFASPVAPSVPHAVQQQAIHQAATQAIAQHYGQKMGSLPAGTTGTVNPSLQLLHQAFAALARANLLPTGAKFPTLMMDQANIPGQSGMYTMNPGGAGGVIHISPMAAKLVAQPGNPKNPLSNWARSGLVHEFAHSMQNAAAHANVPVVEGGAQAWTDKVAPHAIQNWRPFGDTNYTGYVQAMQHGQTPDWINHGQFNPINTDSPTLNPHIVPQLYPFGNLGYMLRSEPWPNQHPLSRMG